MYVLCDVSDAFSFHVRKFQQKVISLHQIYTITFNKLANQTLYCLPCSKCPTNIEIEHLYKQKVD